MNPDERIKLLTDLQKYFAKNKNWSCADVSRETCIPATTIRDWCYGNRKIRNGANAEALRKFLERRMK